MASGRPELDAAPVACVRSEFDDAPVAVMVNGFKGHADTVLHAWSRLQLCNLEEVLRHSPCRNTCCSTRNHCDAMNWSLFRAGGCCDIVSCTLTHAGKQRVQNRRRDFQIPSNKCGVSHDVDQQCQLCPSVSGVTTFGEDVCQFANANGHDPMRRRLNMFCGIMSP